jgi:hypothetical protein
VGGEGGRLSARLGRFASNWGLTISTAGASVLIKVLSFARTVTHVLSD